MVERSLTNSYVEGSGSALFVTHNLNIFGGNEKTPWRTYNQDRELPIWNSRSELSNYEIWSDLYNCVCREHYNIVNSNPQITRSELQISIQMLSSSSIIIVIAGIIKLRKMYV
jgi:hypothetical protein